jgi:saposin
MKVLALVFLALVGASQARVTCINCEEDKQFPSFSIECEICEYMIKIIGELGTDEEPKIEEVVDKVCSKLGSFFEKACDALVRSYLPKLLDALKNGATEQEACSVIRMCSSKKAAVEPVVAKQTKGAGCSVCEFVVGEAAKYIGQDESVIEQKLEEVCNKLGPLSGPCDDLVKDYVPQIIKFLESGKTVDEVCRELGLCSSLESRIAAQKAAVKPVVAKQTKGVECSVCKLLVGEAAKYVGQDQSVIEQKLDEFCSHLSVLSGPCKDLVNEYIPQIIKYLESGQTVDEVCQKLGLCSSLESRIAAQKMFMAHLTGQTKGVTCDICDEVCKWIEDYGVDKGLDAIEHYVDGKCDDLPFISGACKDLVNKWLGKLVALLQQDLPPEKVCQDVHLC